MNAPLAVCAPIGLGLLVHGSHALAARLFPSTEHRASRIATVAAMPALQAWFIVRALSIAHALVSWPTLVATLSVGVASALLAGEPARRLAREDRARAMGLMRRTIRSADGLLSFAVASCALAAALTAAALLIPWAWDSLGYHLPVVYDAMQERTLRRIPTHIPYINVFPHGTDLFYLWWRLLLPDDTWLDTAQIPFALSGMVGIACLSWRSGVAAQRALMFAFLWLAVPVCMLQMATNYVDLAYAAWIILAGYFVTAPVDRSHAWMSGIALGMLLACKPSAPVPVTVFAGTWLVRAFRAGHGRHAVIPILLASGIGLETYVLNVAQHGNPLWPVRFQLGPIRLPGIYAPDVYFNMGVREPYLHYGLLRRVAVSWFGWPRRYVYDMRFGGFGPLFSAGLLPLSVWALSSRRLRPRLAPAALIAAVALATPGAFWARYTLAFPGALLAVVAVFAHERPPRVQSGIAIALGLLACLGIVVSLHGFTDGAVGLRQLWRMNASQRAQAVSVDGAEDRWQTARARLAPGDAIAYDRAFGMPGILWRGDGLSRVVYLDTVPTRSDALRALALRERIRVFVLDARDGGPATAALADAGHFHRLFGCPLEPCVVIAVR